MPLPAWLLKSKDWEIFAGFSCHSKLVTGLANSHGSIFNEKNSELTKIRIQKSNYTHATKLSKKFYLSLFLFHNRMNSDELNQKNPFSMVGLEFLVHLLKPCEKASEIWTASFQLIQGFSILVSGYHQQHHSPLHRNSDGSFNWTERTISSGRSS